MNSPTSQVRRLSLGSRRTGAWVVPVSQTSISISSDNSERTFEAVRTEVLNWIAQRAGRPLPRDAWHGNAFELEEIGTQRTAAAVLAEPVYWAARADDADKSVPKRTWVTEFGLAIASPKEVRFGCRLQCVSQGEQAAIGRSVPWVVGHVVRLFGAQVDGRTVNDQAEIISSEAQAIALTRLLLSRDRRRPVMVVSEHDSEGRQLQGNAVEAAHAIASRTLTLSHVAVVTEKAGFILSEQLGREFSVFNGAVRTYQPYFDPEIDEPTRHPLAFLNSIQSWPDGGPAAFIDFIVSQAFRQSVAARSLELELPAFTTVRQLSIQRKRDSAIARGDSQSDLLGLALEEIETLRRQTEDDRRTSDGLLEAAEDERDEALEELNGVRSENWNLRERVNFLTSAMLEKGRSEDVPIPESFDEIEDWARRYMTGSVLLTNRAARAARKSAFSNPSLAYRAMLVLRDFYVPMKKGLQTRESYVAALAELGLEDSGTFGSTRAGEFGDEYFIRHGGRRRELDRHLKGSNSRDERYGFRLYFFWDEQNVQVVIGSLPSHLTTGIS